ncbi:MAG: pyridoxal 5'-phosphate synthase, partial [Sphingopyxis sp.]
SAKSQQIIGQPQAALLFHWKSLRRQIRIEGRVARVEDDVADTYFATRSRDSRLGAWASDQSQPLATRAEFEARFAAAQASFDGQDVPRPPHWSGYCVTPERMEFWRDREHRLHERWLYSRVAGDGGWSCGMLYP